MDESYKALHVDVDRTTGASIISSVCLVWAACHVWSIACSSFSCVHSTHASAAVEALWHTACDKLGLAPESSECFYIYGCGNELELLLIGEETIGDVMRNWIATEHKCVVSAVATLADRQLVDIFPG